MNLRLAPPRPLPHWGHPAGQQTRGFAGRVAVFALLAILFAMAGLSFSAIGVVYGMDFISPLGVILLICLDHKAHRRLAPYRGMLLILGLCVVAFSCLDLFNGIEPQYFWRGIARNVSFYATFAFGLCLLVRFGLGAFYWVITVTALSIPFHVLLQRDSTLVSLTDLFKFYNGPMLVIPILMGLRGSKIGIIALLAAMAVFLIVFCDYRSGAVICAATAVWVMLFPFLRKLRPIVLGVSMLIAFPIATTLFINYIYKYQLDLDTTRAQRGEMSDAERYDMALDAMEKIRTRPIKGYGTWQNVVLYDARTVQTDVGSGVLSGGVHNALLQLWEEYGLLGFGVALAIGLSILAAISRLAYYSDAVQFEIHPALIAVTCFVLLFTADAYVFGGLLGLARFNNGFQYALVVWLNRTFSDAARGRRQSGGRPERPFAGQQWNRP